MRLRKKTPPSVRIGDIDVSKYVQDVQLDISRPNAKITGLRLSDAIIGRPHGSSVLGAITVSGGSGQPTMMKDEKSGVSVVIRDGQTYTEALDELEKTVLHMLSGGAGAGGKATTFQQVVAPIQQGQSNVSLNPAAAGMSRLPETISATYHNNVHGEERVHLVISIDDLNKWFAEQAKTEELLKIAAEKTLNASLSKNLTRSMQDEAVRETSSALVDLLSHLYATKWLKLEEGDGGSFVPPPAEKPVREPGTKKSVKRMKRGE